MAGQAPEGDVAAADAAAPAGDLPEQLPLRETPMVFQHLFPAVKLTPQLARASAAKTGKRLNHPASGLSPLRPCHRACPAL